MKSAYDIIKKPVLTEKSYDQFASKTYTFEVDKAANKIEIKKAVEAAFKVKVKAVNTLVRKGKVKRFRGFVGKQDDVKKAIVTLEEGHRIDVTTGL